MACQGYGTHIGSYNIYVTAAGKGRWKFDGVGAGSTNQVGNVTVNDGAWHNLCIVYDGSYGYLYVDGTLDVSGTYSAGVLEYDTTPHVTVGRAGNEGYYFTGSIGSCHVYGRALSANEIADTVEYEGQWYPQT